MQGGLTKRGGCGHPVSDLRTEARAGVRPVALFVLGMGRSGTSALTRVLSLCGATLPAGMMGADKHNPLGYWEPRDAVLLNEKILRRHGSNWYDPTLRLQDIGALDIENNAADIAKIQAYLSKLRFAPIVVIKDPRISALSGIWFEAARRAGFDVRVVISVRHPQEVIASTGKYVRTSPELSSALWLKCSLLAERGTRSVPRVFVDYANLLDDWHREIKRISLTLDIDLDDQDDSPIDEFLTPGLRRQRYGGPVEDFFGTDWMSAVYEAMRAAAHDEPWDVSVMDRVYQAYRAGEQGFRTAFDDFRAQTNSALRWIFRPSIAKPIHQVIAMAHRRRGPWA